MSREHNHAAFKKWAEERLEDMRRRACLFCGYPTRHTSQTCPAHRDLAPPIENLLLDAEPPEEVQGSGAGR